MMGMSIHTQSDPLAALPAESTGDTPDVPTERRIRILPPALVNRIAAGEVVERPASVVKELVENALDAGATRVEVRAGAAGRNIRVADNGCGMSPENAALAFYNHATSKIRDAEDLDRIDTLGFRGEALASIGAIARLTCLTRTPDAPVGVKVALDDQGQPVLTEAGCAPGTVMEINDLFYNTPARLKFLKRGTTELGHIEEVVQQLALSHPAVRFTLSINDRIVLQTSGDGDPYRVLEAVFGLERENIRMIPIRMTDEEVHLQLTGFTSEPGVMKSSRRWMMTFVNGRAVRCGILQKAVEAAYESLLPHGKAPLCALFLRMPGGEVDVNVHPAKREVRYASASRIFSFARAGVIQALSAHGFQWEPSAPAHAFASNSQADHPANSGIDPGIAPDRISPEGTSGPFSEFRPSFRPSSPAWPGGGAGSPGVSRAEPEAVQAALRFYEPSPYDDGKADRETASLSETSLSEGASGFSGSSGTMGGDATRFKVVGQLFHTYILLETAQGLMVVDQHIASERFFFETLSNNLAGAQPEIQNLLSMKALTLRPSQRDLLLIHQDAFARLGFLYDISEEGDAIFLRGYPLIYAGRDRMFESGGLFENLLAQLEETGFMKPDLDHLLATLACHSAVRAGDRLDTDEMARVVEGWLACRLPWTCPHGRPIAHTISTQELNRFFHRPSLPVNAY